MNEEEKIWLVRTRVGEILGPYSQRELLEELEKNAFSSQDEIAPSFGLWISAQTLLNRDSDELTRTSTRNTAITRSTESNLALESEEATPTPDFLSPQNSSRLRPVPRENQTPSKNPVTFLLLGILAVSSLWALVRFVRPEHTPPPKVEALVAAAPSSENKIEATDDKSQPPFLKNVYKMIEAGQTATALKSLKNYHEKLAEQDEVDYLVPYAALLITEQKATSLARKLLDKTLASTHATRELKAAAHHWLGYLMLVTEERDIGESHFLDALQLSPRDPASRFNLGRTYIRQGKYRQAIDYLNQAELEVPNLWLVHIYKGRARAALNLPMDAGNSFSKSVSLSKDRWLCYIYHALFLMKREKGESAQRLMRQMLTRDPGYDAATPAPFGFFQERTNLAEYLNAYTLVMAAAPGEERELGKLYISYLMHGPGGDEARRLEALADKGSLNAKVFALKVALDKEGSLEEIKKALTRLPKNLSDFGYYAYVLRGEAHLRLQDASTAEQDFVLALQLEPGAAIAQYAYATLLRRSGQDAKAKEKIESLLATHPGYIPAIVFSQNF